MAAAPVLELTAGPYRVDVHLEPPMPTDVLADVLTALGRAGFVVGDQGPTIATAELEHLGDDQPTG